MGEFGESEPTAAGETEEVVVMPEAESIAEQRMDETFVKLVDLVLVPLKLSGVSDEIIADYKKRLIGHFVKSDYKSIKETCIGLRKTYSYLKQKNVDQLVIYASNTGPCSPITERDEIPDHEIDAMILAFKQRVAGGSDNQVYNVSGGLSFNDVKKLIMGTVDFCQDGPSSSKLPFYISDEYEESGIITSNVGRQDKQFTVYQVSMTNEGELIYSFLGDTTSRTKPVVSKAALSLRLHTYKFVAESGSEMVLFSVVPLGLGRNKLTGMRISVTDRSPFGDTTKFTTLRRVVFVQSATPYIQTLDETSARVMANKYDREKLMQCIRGGYAHPDWFESFLAAWLLSGKPSGYPLHLAWLSEAGTGKTAVMKCIHTQYQERQLPASLGTLKGLVPNFGNAEPSEGYFCKCQRVGLVDEFFAILRRSTNGHDDNDSGTSLLLSILEHQTYQGDSGKHPPITVKPSMRAMFISNMKNYYGFENLTEASKHMSNAFMSRILWYVQTGAHTAFVDANKSRIAQLEARNNGPLNPVPEDDFLSLSDYLSSFLLEYRPEDTDRIYEKYLTIIPEALTEVYRGRYKHHISCIIDGVAKLNWILEKRVKLEVTEKDVQQAEELFATIVCSWLETNTLTSDWVDVSVKLNYLSIDQRRVYDYIKERVSTRAELLEKFPKNGVAIISFLLSSNLLDQFNEEGVWKYRLKGVGQ